MDGDRPIFEFSSSHVLKTTGAHLDGEPKFGEGIHPGFNDSKDTKCLMPASVWG